MADRHEAQILGMGVCTLNRWAAPALDAINTYYHRPEIAIGSIQGDLPGPTKESVYTEYLARTFPNRLRDGLRAPEVVSLYRHILSAQPDHSVVFVAIGWLRNLQNLLESKPDSVSLSSGRDLVAAKVKILVDMGPKIDPPGIGWNFEQDPESARYVVRNWPTPVVFSPKEVCWAMTGSRLKETPESNPVRNAYELWLAKSGHGRNTNHSADLTAALFAVRGLGNYWTVGADGSLEIESNGFSRWIRFSTAQPDKLFSHQSYLIKKMEFDELARQLDELLIQPPVGEK
jgi:hypothetical protein